MLAIACDADDTESGISSVDAGVTRESATPDHDGGLEKRNEGSAPDSSVHLSFKFPVESESTYDTLDLGGHWRLVVFSCVLFPLHVFPLVRSRGPTRCPEAPARIQWRTRLDGIDRRRGGRVVVSTASMLYFHDELRRAIGEFSILKWW